MDELDAFSTAATPVFADLGDGGAVADRATEALGPFSSAGDPGATSLGDAAERRGPDLVASDPVIRQVRGLAKSGEPATTNLGKLLASLRKTDGFEYLNDSSSTPAARSTPFDQLRPLPARRCCRSTTASTTRSIPEAAAAPTSTSTVSAARSRAGARASWSSASARELASRAPTGAATTSRTPPTSGDAGPTRSRPTRRAPTRRRRARRRARAGRCPSPGRHRRRAEIDARRRGTEPAPTRPAPRRRARAPTRCAPPATCSTS